MQQALSCIIIYLLIQVGCSHASTISIGMEIKVNSIFGSAIDDSTKKSPPGIYVELMNEVARNLDIKFEFIERPWKRVLQGVKIGSLNAVIGSSYTDERAIYSAYPLLNGVEDSSKSISVRSYALYQKENDIPLWDGQTFKSEGIIIAAMRGYAIINHLKKMGVELVEVDSKQQLFSMLLLGRVDGVVDIEIHADDFLNNNQELTIGVVKNPLPIIRRHYYLAFSKVFEKNNVKLTEKIWDEIEKVRNSEVYREIKSRYKTGN